MLDIKFIRENPGIVKDNIKRKFQDDKLVLVDQLIEEDVEYRALLKESQELRSSRNKLSEEINKAKKEGKDPKEIITKAKDIPKKIKDNEERLEVLQNGIKEKQMMMPNIMKDDVPSGKDDTENVEDQRFGEPKERDIPFHGDIMEKMGIADFDAARRVAGKGFHYLKGGLAELDNALLQFAIDFMKNKGYTMIVPPNLISSDVVNGVMTFAEKEDMIYSIEGEDLNLIGTAEHSLIGMFKDTVLQEKELPIKVFASTACYRKEIGAHGLDDKGCFRVHQFNKVEQIVICKPDQSDEMYDELLSNSVEILKQLDIPFRTLRICTGDLGDLKRTMHDVELWSPRKKDWIETMSCSNLTDAQALLLNIKIDGGPGNRYYAHTLNDTAVATSRLLVAIVENNWDPETNTILIPEALRKYMGNKEKIESIPAWFR